MPGGLAPADQRIVWPLQADEAGRHVRRGEVGDRQRGDERHLGGLGGRLGGVGEVGGGEVAGAGLPTAAAAAAPGGLAFRGDPERAVHAGLGSAARLGVGGVDLLQRLDRWDGRAGQAGQRANAAAVADQGSSQINAAMTTGSAKSAVA